MADATERGARGEAVIRTRGLAVGYGAAVVARDVDLRVEAGRIVTLVGPNGAGKSTVLKTLAAQLPPLAGDAALCGVPYARLSDRERSRMIAVVLTERPRTELMTCQDVVELGRYPHTGRLGLLGEHDRVRVREAMEMVHAWDLRDRDFMRISDGQRQRVLLARAVCQEPRAILLDEPTSYLDIHYQIELLGLLRRLARERGLGMLMSLHELSLAREVSDWVVCLRDGRVMAQGTPAEVFVPSVIDRLYDLAPGSFDPATGRVVLPGADGHGEGE